MLIRPMLRFLPILVATVIAACFWTIAPAAQALSNIGLEDIGYRPCPPEVAKGTVSPGGMSRPANCFLIYGIANNTTGKLVVNADVFGRIYDANHNATMENRTRLGGIAEVPPGKSEFSIRVSVPATQPEPLILEQFKASGFTGKVRR